jgi:hypothetical protein
MDVWHQLSPPFQRVADSPFIASSDPPGLISVPRQFLQTWQAGQLRGRSQSHAALLHILGSSTDDRYRKLPATASSRRNSTRRSRGSIRVTFTSGRASAITIPGSPAPDPISKSSAPSGNKGGDWEAVKDMALPDSICPRGDRLIRVRFQGARQKFSVGANTSAPRSGK